MGRLPVSDGNNEAVFGMVVGGRMDPSSERVWSWSRRGAPLLAAGLDVDAARLIPW